MMLRNHLAERKDTLLARWFRLIIESYPPDLSNFLSLEKDRFANPVGYTISHGIAAIFDGLIHEADSDRVIEALDSIIRIRAVQEFTPSQALSFVFLLKKAVREELNVRNVERTAPDKIRLLEELGQLETKIDGLASLAFDVYVKCRDDINRIRVDKANADRAMTMRLARMTRSRGEE
jgi:hypothetical protein